MSTLFLPKKAGFRNYFKLAALVGASALVVGAATSVEGATYYLQSSQPNTNPSTINYNSAGWWYTTPSGGGTTVTASGTTNFYDVNGFVVRTNINTNSFNGTNLILSKGGTVATHGTNVTVANLIVDATGGFISRPISGLSTMIGTTLTLNGVLNVNNNAAANSLAVNYTNLTGAGNMVLNGSASSIGIRFVTATSYTGNISASNVNGLTFSNSFATAGGLSISGDTKVASLAGNTVGFYFMTINGAILNAGTYSYGDLRLGTYGGVAGTTIFNNEFGTGSFVVAVPEPSTWMLIGASGLFLVLVRGRSSARRRAAIGA